MRTTVDIPEELLRVAKEQATRRGESLSGLVQRALRAHLDASRHTEDAPFELLVAGHPGGRVPSPAEVHRLLDEEDWGRPR